MAAISGRTAALYVLDTTTSTSETPSKTMSAVVAGKIYRIATSNGDKRFVDYNSSTTVKYDTVTKTYGTDYYWSGPCLINKTGTTPTAVTVEAYKYWTTKAVGVGTEWSLNVEQDVEDYTAFGAAAWKNKIGNQTSATVDISQFWEDGDILSTHLNSLFVLVLFTSLTTAATRTGKRYECYGKLTKDSIKNAANGIVGEDLTINVDGRVYYFAT